MSYENGGNINSTLCEKWIGKDLFFHIEAEQRFGGSLNELFIFKNDKVNQIIFTEEANKLIVLKTLRISKNAKEWYDENKNAINNTEEDLARLNLLSEFYGKSFNYFKMTTNDKKFSEEKTYLRRNGLEDYKPFIIDDQKKIEKIELNEIEKI
ncbi:MAG: hypothetical protein LUH15_05990 [Tannerellaceae bacterium]|nr:hypothetical protein [Tannerellaceae bacterium]